MTHRYSRKTIRALGHSIRFEPMSFGRISAYIGDREVAQIDDEGTDEETGLPAYRARILSTGRACTYLENVDLARQWIAENLGP